jgi:hypothetical protein
MMKFEVSSSGDEQIATYLADLEYRVTDLKPLAVEIGALIEVDNMAARMLGVDKDNQPFAELAPATLADPYRGPGPPLAPMEMASRIISGLEIEFVDLGIDGVDIVGSWPSMPFLRFHVTGTRHMPARDPVGIRPHGWAAIEDALDRFGDSFLAGV